MPRPRNIPLHCQQFLEENDPTTTTKVCTMCKEPKRLVDFYWNANCLTCYRPECIECNNARYNSLDPSGFRRKLFIGKRADAKGKGIEFSIELDDVDFPDVCPLTGSELLYQPGSKPLANTPSFDKINPLLGYIPGNVQVISALANSVKSNIDISMLEKLLAYMKRGNDDNVETNELTIQPENITQRINKTDEVDTPYRVSSKRRSTSSSNDASATSTRKRATTRKKPS